MENDKPAGIGPETSATAVWAKVFVSYARADRPCVLRIGTALETSGVDVLRDEEDILPTEAWKARIVGLIGSSDALLCMLSPQFAGSEVCAWEVETARSLGKRLVPIVVEDLGPVDAPPAVSELNWLFWRRGDNAEAALGGVLAALRLDIPWVREHTRLWELATHWNAQGRPESLLLRGKALEDAEAWLSFHPRHAPEPSSLHHHFILAGRQESARRSRRTTGVTIAVAATTAVLAIAAVRSASDARANLRVADARRLSVLGERALDEGYPQRAALLVSSAILTTLSNGEPIPEPASAARRLLGAMAGDVLHSLNGRATAMAAGAGARRVLLASIGPDGGNGTEVLSRLEVLGPDAGRHALRVVCKLAVGSEPVVRIEIASSERHALLVTRSRFLRVALDESACRVEAELPYEEGDDRVLAVDQEARRVAIGSTFGERLVLLDVAGVEPVKEWGPFAGRLSAATFVPNRRALLVGSPIDVSSRAGAPVLAAIDLADGVVRPLLAKGQAERLGSGTPRVFRAIRQGTDIRVGVGYDDGVLGLASLRDAAGEPLMLRSLSWHLTADGSGLAPRPSVESLAFLRSADQLVVGLSDGTLAVWDSGSQPTVRVRQKIAERGLRYLAVDAAGSHIAIGARDNSSLMSSFHACDLEAARLECRQLLGHEGPAVGVVMSDRREVVTAALDSTLRSWPMGAIPASAAERIPALGDGRLILTPGGRLYQVGSQGRLAFLWPPELAPSTFPDGVTGLGDLTVESVSENGRWALVSGAGAQQWHAMDLDRGEWHPVAGNAVPNRRGATAVSNDGSLLALLDTERAVMRILGESGVSDGTTSVKQLDHLVFAPRARVLVGATEGGDLWRWRLQPDGRIVDERRLATGVGDIRTIALNPAGTIAVAAGYEAKAWAWSLACTDCPPSVWTAQSQLRVARFSADGQRLAIGSVSGWIAMWNRLGRHWTEPQYLRGHDGDVKDLNFSRDGQMLVSGSFSWTSSDNSVRSWPLSLSDASGRASVIERGESWIRQVFFDRDGSHVIALGDDAEVRVWPTSATAIAEQLKLKAGRDLSSTELAEFFPGGRPDE